MADTPDRNARAPACDAFLDGLERVLRARIRHDFAGTPAPAPLNRAALLLSLDADPHLPGTIEGSATAWFSILAAAMRDDLPELQFGRSRANPGSAQGARDGMLDGWACSRPDLSVEDLLMLLSSVAEITSPEELDETLRIPALLERAAELIDGFDVEHAEAIAYAHAPYSLMEPRDVLCAPPVAAGPPRRPTRVAPPVPASR